MNFLGPSCILLLCGLLLAVSTAPVQEPEVKPSKRHNLNSDKEQLLAKLKDIENKLEGRRSSQVPGDDNPAAVAEPRKKEAGASSRDENLVASLLGRDSKDKASQDGVDPGKKALQQFLDNARVSGQFVDEPFSDTVLGQIPGDNQKEEDDIVKKEANDFDKNDMTAMLDSISFDDLKQLLSDFKENKRELDSNDMMDRLDFLTIDDLKQLLSMLRQNKPGYSPRGLDGEDANDEEGQDGVGETGGDDDDDDGDSNGFLQGISVQELKELIETVKQKKQDGALTPGDLGKVVYYLVTHLTTDDLQTMLDAAKDQEKEEEEEDDDDNDGMTDEEIGQAIQNLVSHISADQLQSLLAAVKARKQELDDNSEESEESSNEDGLEDRELHQTEEEVMQALLDFLSGLSTEELQKTILAVKRKKMEMKQAVGDITGEYIQANDDTNDDDDDIHKDDDVTDDGNNDEVKSDDLGPCAQEKQDILDTIEAARLANSHLLGGEVPNCDEDGFYAPKQCSGSMCYCVDKHGTVTEGEAMIWEATSLVCSQDNDDTSSDSSSEEDASSDVSEDDKDDDEDEESASDDDAEETKLEQVERDLLEMLKEQKRQQLSKNGGLNM